MAVVSAHTYGLLLEPDPTAPDDNINKERLQGWFTPRPGATLTCFLPVFLLATTDLWSMPACHDLSEDVVKSDIRSRVP